MGTHRSWTDEALRLAVAESSSYRSVLIKLGLVPAGGNYFQIKLRIEDLKLSTAHFTGKGWNVGLGFKPNPAQPLVDILILNGRAQSYVLKKRLFKEGLKTPACELCGWNQAADDGRIPVELDHINGNHRDNRLENLRVLCPNCHSLQSTHRGKNIRLTNRASGGMVYTIDLKSVGRNGLEGSSPSSPTN